MPQRPAGGIIGRRRSVTSPLRTTPSPYRPHAWQPVSLRPVISRPNLALYGLVVLIAGAVLGARFGGAIFDQDVSRGLRKVEEVFVSIAQRYVDPVDADELAEDAIRGMLEALDPHSVYVNERRTRLENEQFNAEFEGIGVAYGFIPGDGDADTLSVVEVLPGGPSEMVGLYSGDRIVAIDDSTAIGISDPDVRRRLRGPRGTLVSVTIVRPGTQRPIEIEIRRNRVSIVTVDAAWMLDDRTGVIRLNRFARTTHREFREALRTLVEQGMARLVLDLRGNPGGLMSAAVPIAGEFLERGQVIVSQRGRAEDANDDFRARGGGLWTTGPLMVLVDGGSASASEIVAGAIQDHDRGLIVGRRSFGKGLVQNQIPLDDGSAIRLTVARFFTPSGRLIQTAYENGDREGYYEDKHARLLDEGMVSLAELAADAPDSLKYRTDSGRTVLSGGGIVPDFVIRDSTKAFLRAVVMRGIEQDFVRTMLDRDGERLRAAYGDDLARFIDEFRVNNVELGHFREHASRKGIHVGTRPDDDGSEDLWFTQDQFDQASEDLRLLLKGRIARRLYDRAAWYPVWAPADLTLQQSRALWPETSRLSSPQPGG